MRILPLSDLHLEFSDWKLQKKFIAELDPSGVDVLILAGDICIHKQLLEAMSLICKRFEDAAVIWVHGNHEYYTTTRENVIELTRAALQQNSNLRWLNRDIVEVKGQRFLGGTMWFKDDPMNMLYEHQLNDFRVIKGFRDWNYQENALTVEFLNREVRPTDVVVTHHLPAKQSIAGMYGKGGLNNFYLCDMEALIRDRGPRLWVHGHTHHSFDYQMEHTTSADVTRVVCNPRGYAPYDLNPDFDRARVIEL